MKSFVVLLTVFVCAYGDFEIHNIYKDDTELYKKGDKEIEKGWEKVGKDETYNIEWYESDPTVQLAFSENHGLAAARLVIPTGKHDDFYKNSIEFEEKKIKGKDYYISTVLLEDPAIIRNQNKGRFLQDEDEIVDTVHIKYKNGEVKRIQREACYNHESNIFNEQGCKKGYGLVFSPLKKEDNSCNRPFFLVYDEDGKGHLLGFGWFFPAGDVANSKELTDDEIKALFPSPPDCLKGKATVNVWLARETGKKEKCKVNNGEFVEKRCNYNRRGGGDENL